MVKTPVPFGPFQLGHDLEEFTDEYGSISEKWNRLEARIINILDLTHDDLLQFGIDHAEAHDNEPYRFIDKIDFYEKLIDEWETQYAKSTGDCGIIMKYRVSMISEDDNLTVLQRSHLFDNGRDARKWAQVQDVDWTKTTFRICMVFEEVLVVE